MKTVEEFREALNAKQRIARKQSFKKNKAKIMRGREKAAKKKATPEKLKGRAEAGARKALENKLLKGKSKSDLSFSEKEKLEKKLKKKSGAIKRIAKKMLPGVRKKDAEKLQKKTEESTINDERKEMKDLIKAASGILNEAGMTRAIYILKGSVQVGRPARDGQVKVKPAIENDMWDFVEGQDAITIEFFQFYEGDTDNETMVHFVGMYPDSESDWNQFTKQLVRYDRRFEFERLVA